jgi:CubicO group peptidase (beta-lactamase class C family)
MNDEANQDPATKLRQLERFVDKGARDLAVPGTAVGIYASGEEFYVFRGITSVRDPLPVDAATLFQVGSVTKPYTATAVMQLAEAGMVDLSMPVRRYVPEFRLRDEHAARHVTVLHLLNHTAGFAGDFFCGTGDGDDALAIHTERLRLAAQLTFPGTAASYNNAAFCLAGRVIEVITERTFEDATAKLVLGPLMLGDSYLRPGDALTRRLAVGHVTTGGRATVADGWTLPRRATPAGGLITTASELMAFARFHLGEGGVRGRRVLAPGTLRRMRTPTIPLSGGYPADYAGIGWLLTDVGGTRLVGHDGAANGQRAVLQLVPDRDFAVAVLTNSEVGGVLGRAVLRWVLDTYLGVCLPEPRPLALSGDHLGVFAGTYVSRQVALRVRVHGDHLVIVPQLTDGGLAEFPAAARAAPHRLPAAAVKILPGGRFVVIDGPDQGTTGAFGDQHGPTPRRMSFQGKLYFRQADGGGEPAP